MPGTAFCASASVTTLMLLLRSLNALVSFPYCTDTLRLVLHLSFSLHSVVASLASLLIDAHGAEHQHEEGAAADTVYRKAASCRWTMLDEAAS